MKIGAAAQSYCGVSWVMTGRSGSVRGTGSWWMRPGAGDGPACIASWRLPTRPADATSPARATAAVTQAKVINVSMRRIVPHRREGCVQTLVLRAVPALKTPAGCHVPPQPRETKR